MIEAAAINTGATAFIAGLLSSLHCVAMCGPIACSVCSGCSEDNRFAAAGGYHGARIIGYGIAGSIAGAAGALPMGWLMDSPPSLIPWLMVGMFLFMALGLDQSFKAGTFQAPWFLRMKLAILSRPRWQGSVLLGMITPLIPCGLLYILWLACLLSGSPLRGAELALGFGCGTVPALLLAQAGLGIAGKRLTPKHLRVIQRSIAFMAVAVLVWRLRADLGLAAEGGFLCH